MIICVTPDDIARNGRTRFGGRLVEIIGDRSVPWDGPICHLVHQIAHSTNRPHFHKSDQYQVFVAGRGRFGGHEIRPGSVHYSDGFSGYGPIVTDEESCSYVTLRSTFDLSLHPLPQDAALARGRKGRQYLAHLDLSADVHEGVTTLFERPDGVAMYQVNVAAGRSVPEIATLGGSFWLVIKGDVNIGGRPCPEGSCAWVGEAEARPPIAAGYSDAIIAVMCFATANGQAMRGIEPFRQAT